MLIWNVRKNVGSTPWLLPCWQGPIYEVPAPLTTIAHISVPISYVECWLSYFVPHRWDQFSVSTICGHREAQWCVVFPQPDVAPPFSMPSIIQQTLRKLDVQTKPFLSGSTSDLLFIHLFFLGESPKNSVCLSQAHATCAVLWPGLCQWWLWSPGTQQPAGGDPGASFWITPHFLGGPV